MSSEVGLALVLVPLLETWLEEGERGSNERGKAAQFIYADQAHASSFVFWGYLFAAGMNPSKRQGVYSVFVVAVEHDVSEFVGN